MAMKHLPRAVLGALALCLSLLPPALADDGPYDVTTRRVAKELQQRALAGSPAFAHVESLTTEIGPRLAGSAANHRAEQWALARFKQLGLVNIRAESFTVDGWERGIETAAITAPAPQPLHVTALGHSVATPPEGVEAEIVRFETLEDLEAAPAGSLTGKIAYVAARMPKLQDGAGYGLIVSARSRGPDAAAGAARSGC